MLPQMIAIPERTRKALPVFSKLASQRSFTKPPPTAIGGPAKNPAKNLATNNVVMVLDIPQTIVKIRQIGSVA